MSDPVCRWEGIPAEDDGSVVVHCIGRLFGVSHGGSFDVLSSDIHLDRATSSYCLVVNMPDAIAFGFPVPNLQVVLSVICHW
jgi:hypothetical protein